MALLMCFVYLIIAGLTLLAYKVHKNLTYWQSRGIPCESPHPIYGYLAGVQNTKGLSDIWSDYYKKFKGCGPYAGIYLSQTPAVFLLDIDLIKNVLVKDFAKFTDRGLYCNEEDDPLSGQLFSLDGHKWKFMRAKLSPTFTSGKMKFMFPTVVKVGYEFVKAFDELLQKTSVVEVRELLARFTTDVIGTCAFGIDCNSLKDPEAEFRLMGKKIFTDQRHGILGLALITVFPKLARRLHIKSTPDHIEKFFLRIVNETVEYREKNNIRRNDFMDMLIDLKNNKGDLGNDEMRGLTIGEIAAQTFIFFGAGFESSSTTLGYVLFELARNENIQERVREEINNVLQKHNNQLTYECMNEFTYMGQVIAEILRLYTVVPVLNRVCLEDYQIPGYPNHAIKKGTGILIPNADIHRDPDYYPNPNTFNPDNFNPEQAKKRDNILWLPFGEGPRNCIGMRFAQMQMRVGLALLLQKFKFSVCEKTPKALEYDKKSILNCPLGGIFLKVEKV